MRSMWVIERVIFSTCNLPAIAQLFVTRRSDSLSVLGR